MSAFLSRRFLCLPPTFSPSFPHLTSTHLSLLLPSPQHCLYQQEESTFAQSREFGFLIADPTQAGTALTLAYTLKLDRLSDPTYLLPSLCARLGLQCRPEQRGLDCNLWVVGTAHSVGLTEAEAAQVLVDGAAALIRLEKLLERGDSEGFAHAVAGLPRAFALPPVFSAPRQRDSDDDGDEEGAVAVRVAVSADDDYPVLTPAHTSLMAKHMTRELYKVRGGRYVRMYI